MSPRIPRAGDFVHAGRDGRWYVAEWVERAAQYQWPLPARTARASGCSGGFSRRCEGSDWSYATRAQALRAARHVFAGAIADARREAEEDAPEGRAVAQEANERFQREMDAALERDMQRGEVW